MTGSNNDRYPFSILYCCGNKARRGAMARKAAQTNLATGASQYGDDGFLVDPEMDWKEMLDVLRAINDEVEAEDRRRARAAGVPLGAKGGARASATKRIAAARVAERELARQQLRAEADYALSCMDGTAAAARKQPSRTSHRFIPTSG